MIRTLTKVDDRALMEIAEEKRIRKTKELFLLFSLGSQFDHLIALALAKLGVYCLVADPASVTAEDVKKLDPAGIILSGGPVSVYDKPPPFDGKIFDLGIPVLGICLGFQLWAEHIGCRVVKSEKREFGAHELCIDNPSNILMKCGHVTQVLESHGDMIEIDGHADLQVLGRTENCPIAAAWHDHLYGVQFHPEVTETADGQ